MLSWDSQLSFFFNKNRLFSFHKFIFYYPEKYCEPDPCLNNGTCVEAETTFHCECEEGYQGKLCQGNV